jgi:hypothetical protein
LLLSSVKENENKILANLYFEESKPNSADINSDDYINKVILFGYVMVNKKQKILI